VEDQPQQVTDSESLENSKALRLVEDDTAALRQLFAGTALFQKSRRSRRHDRASFLPGMTRLGRVGALLTLLRGGGTLARTGGFVWGAKLNSGTSSVFRPSVFFRISDLGVRAFGNSPVAFSPTFNRHPNGCPQANCTCAPGFKQVEFGTSGCARRVPQAEVRS
jgi:hypothetical protein